MHISMLNFVIVSNQSNICASTITKRQTKLHSVLKAGMRLKHSKMEDTCKPMKPSGESLDFLDMTETHQFSIYQLTWKINSITLHKKMPKNLQKTSKIQL